MSTLTNRKAGDNISLNKGLFNVEAWRPFFMGLIIASVAAISVAVLMIKKVLGK